MDYFTPVCAHTFTIVAAAVKCNLAAVVVDLAALADKGCAR